MWDAIDVPLVETVKRAIETELSPNSSHEDRKSAHEVPLCDPFSFLSQLNKMKVIDEKWA